MKSWIDEQTGCKMCEPDCVDEWLFDIWAIGCDYDGCHSLVYMEVQMRRNDFWALIMVLFAKILNVMKSHLG